MKRTPWPVRILILAFIVGTVASFTIVKDAPPARATTPAVVPSKDRPPRGPIFLSDNIARYWCKWLGSRWVLTFNTLHPLNPAIDWDIWLQRASLTTVDCFVSLDHELRLMPGARQEWETLTRTYRLQRLPSGRIMYTKIGGLERWRTDWYPGDDNPGPSW
jgi:hypothetical protein